MVRSERVAAVIAVGGVVIRDERILLVRMTYGPTQGRFMLPGGLVEPGETVDDAIVREVWEETGVESAPLGICAVRTRHDDGRNDLYVVFVLEAIRGEPRADGRENSEVRYFAIDELDAPDVTDLSRFLGRRVLRGERLLLELAADFPIEGSGRDPRRWKLFA